MTFRPVAAALLALAAGVIALPAFAQRVRAPATPPADASAEYRRCIERAAEQPLEALADADGWAARGGGDPARHCAALALLNAGRAREAAERLERLADEWQRPRPELRAEVLAQAGRAWVEAGDPSRANAVFTTALQISPNNIEVYVDRAEALAAAGSYWEAIDDLNHVIELNPRRADALAMRAAAYRYVESLELAAADAEQAVAIDASLPEAWLERGIIARLRGNLAQARADWGRALRLDPEGPVGDAVRANIERLELRLDETPAQPAPPAQPRPAPTPRPQATRP